MSHGELVTTPPADELRTMRRANRLAQERIRASRLQWAEKREARRQVTESLSYDWIAPYAELLDLTRRTGDPLIGGPTSVWQRKQGRNWPFYQTEQELNLLRAPARVLLGTNGYAQGLVEGLTSYVVGPGCTYAVALEDDDDDLPPAVVKAAQWVVDETLRRNQWFGGEQPGVEEEFFGRSLEDGETVLAHYPDADGWTSYRFHDPEALTQPPGADFREYGFGVRTPPDDAQKILAYWLQHGDSPGDGEEYDPEEVTHLRCNVRRNMKRGIPDFSFDGYDSIYTSGKLRAALGDTATQQAGIVGVMQHDNAAAEDVQAFRDAEADYTQTDYPSNTQTPVKLRRRGGWEDIPKGQSYVAGPLANSSPIHIQVLDACLRGAGRKWQAPPWLMSGDLNAMNYATSLTAESPFTKTILRRQRGYTEAFRRAVWFALRHYARTRGLRDKTGRVWSWEDVGHRLKLVVTAPSPETRNKLEEAQRAQIEIPLGVQSRRKYASEQSRDWDEIQADNQAHQDETGGDGDSLPLPGEGGAVDRTPGDGQPAGGANDLKGTVGGMQAIQAAQTAFYAGQIPRAAAVANMVTVFGFTQQQAEALFPDVKPVDRTQPAADEGGAVEALAPEPTPTVESVELLESHGPPPSPGLSFDESKHRWVNPHTGESHPHADAPPDAEVLGDLQQKVPAGTWAKVKDAALTATAKAYMAIVRATPATIRVLDLVKDALDNPDDVKRWGGMYQANVGVAGPGAATDHVRNATGISTHLAMSIASKVLAKGLVYARKKLGSAKRESEDGDGFAEAAEILTGVLSHVGEALGLKLDGRKVAGLVRELAGRQRIESLLESAPPGPPPRPGLAWKDSTKRWVHPVTGEEHAHPASGGGRATVSKFDSGVPGRFPAVAAEVFGSGASPEHLADAVGAGPGDRVKVSQARVLEDGTRYIGVDVTTADGVGANRGVHFDPKTGRRWVFNDSIGTETPGTGAGTKLITRQVENLSRMGFDQIEASADSDGKNGYYTLPRWGFDGPIPARTRQKLPPEFAGAKTVLDLMGTPAGRDWWKKNGTAVDVTFDLKPGSRSHEVLAAYLAGRAGRS